MQVASLQDEAHTLKSDSLINRLQNEIEGQNTILELKTNEVNRLK